ncbi:MAG: OmpA family protein [Nitrospirae bacterium]|nr:OmpA family protein [Nitrospirota bacterium]
MRRKRVILCGVGMLALVGCSHLEQAPAPNDSVTRNLNEMKARPKAPVVVGDNRDSRISDLERQLADRDAELAKLRDAGGNLVAANRRSDDLANQLSDRDRELARVRQGAADASAANRRIGELEAQIADRDRELARLRQGLGDMEGANKRIGDLERQLSDRDGELGRLRPIVAAHEKEGNMAGDVDSLKKQLADREAEMARLKAIEKEHDVEHPELDRVKQQVIGLNGTVNDRDQEIARLKGLLAAQPKAEMVKAEKDLVKALQPEIKAGNVSVSQAGNKLKVNLASNLLFDSGKDELKPAGVDVLKRVGNVLHDFPEKKVHVAGYTDNVPIRSALKKKFPTNKELSDARAANSSKILAASGVSAANMTAMGHGENDPVGDNKTGAGRGKNRRVEIVVSD